MARRGSISFSFEHDPASPYAFLALDAPRTFSAALFPDVSQHIFQTAMQFLVGRCGCG